MFPPYMLNDLPKLGRGASRMSMDRSRSGHRRRSLVMKLSAVFFPLQYYINLPVSTIVVKMKDLVTGFDFSHIS